MEIDVLFTPAEFEALSGRDLRDFGCVVLDVLRATSTMVTALSNGARAIRAVSTIAEALDERQRRPDSLLAGERDGVRIGAEQTGGVIFDLGNSPREFTRERVAGRRIVLTTTNGTRALQACAQAGWVAGGAMLNLSAAVEAARVSGRQRWLIVCAGTGEAASYEDALVAGAFCAALGKEPRFSDAARIALGAWRAAASDLGTHFCQSRNAQRLLAHSDLAADVDYCRQQDLHPLVPVRGVDGEFRLDTCSP